MSLVRTIDVTVSNPGSGNRYYLDGVLTATANLGVGGSFRFDQSDSSNGGHPLKFSTTSNGTHGGGSEYTSGVTYNGTPGQAGAYTEIEITSSTPTTLYYYCQYHSGMGGTVTITANSWGALTWNNGTWNFQNAVAELITGIQSTTSAGTVVIGEGTGNTVSITGLSIPVDLNFGDGWGREEWNTGAWNEGLGDVISGDGNVFIEDGQSVTASINSITISASSPFTISGQVLNTALGQVVNEGQVILSIAGQQMTGSIGTYSITADGNHTIVVSELEMTTALNSITTGSANSMNIVGQGLTSSLSNITTGSGNIIPIIGINSNANVSSVVISSSGFFPITGQEITINLAAIIPNSNNNISMTGIQANVIPTDLRFWDPIVDNNTETWTNI